MKVEFNYYFNFNEEVSIIKEKESTFSTIAKQVTLIVLKLLSYLSVILPIICGFGLWIQTKPPLVIDQGSGVRNSLEISGNLLFKSTDESLPEVVGIPVENEPFKDLVRFFSQYEGVDDYQCEPRECWVMFDHKDDLSIYKSTSVKFHISIDDEDLIEAYKIILPILFREKISTFKVINPNDLATRSKESNTNGKEFCVYFQSNEEDKVEEIAKEIDLALKHAQIATGSHSTGDVLVSGTAYIYFRSPNNVFGCYIAAKHLQDAGFTAKESAGISTPTGPFNVAVDWGTIDLDKSKNISTNFSKETIIEKLLNSSEFCIQFHNLLCPKLTGSGKEAYKRVIPCGNFRNSIFMKSEIFKGIMEDAARDIGVKFESMNLPIDQMPGNILPALYHSIIVPLSKSLDSYKRDEDVQKEFDAHLEEHREKILSYIVECGLRDRSQVQIYHETPIYLT